MDRLKKSRAPTRATFTKIANELREQFRSENSDIAVLKVKIKQLVTVYDKLQILDEQVKEAMLDADVDERSLQVEEECVQKYTEEWFSLSIPVYDRIEVRLSSPPESESNVYTPSESKKRNFKLPKIELKKFNGELKEWLGFWSQFQKIDDDETLHDTDKFQYLVQAMVPGSEAHDLVQSFPQSTENYPKAVEALKKRFGKESLLIQVYVRELLKLAFHNVTQKEKIPLPKMFIQLKSHLRALESLKLATADPSTWLFPLVESSLTEDMLRAWQRSQLSKEDGSSQQPPKTHLDYLIEFLEREVEGEQRIEIAKTGFGDLTVKDKSSYKKQVVRERERTYASGIPTTAGLHVGGSSSCIFCGKSHLSQECFKAQEMGVREKNRCINQKKACFLCLRLGHQSKECKASLKCTGCGKKHFHLMCPENAKNRATQRTEEVKEVETTNVGANQVIGGLVLLKTLLVAVDTPTQSMQLRVLFDDGSQRSYIRSKAAKLANCLPMGTYYERNALFGGVVSEPKLRTIYKVPLSSLNRNIRREVDISDTEKIAINIPKVPFGPWLTELRSKKIWLSDCVKNKDEPPEEIDVLIGADLMSSLITGKNVTLKCGLHAMETVFGWTLMGRVPENRSDTSCRLLSTVLLLTDFEVPQLWELELLGIRDPAENKSKQEKEAEVHKHFRETVTRQPDGRYQISLPWIAGRQEIPDNYKVAEKRLITATNKLKNDSKFEIYDGIFKQWVQEGYIEETFEESIQCHYVPHRPVYKPESKTTPVRPVFDASAKVGRNPSLNDCLEKGPNLIESIPSIMLRFREGKIGVLSDIRKAFQQIEMVERDQDYLRFLWWEDARCKKLKVFKHKRVVFGVNSSPFILAAVIEYHLDNVRTEDEVVAKKLKSALYVDNCVTSVENQREYELFKEDATRIMNDAKMELREWECGAVETPGIGQLTSGCGLGLGSDQELVSSVLGMKWDRWSDTLKCDLVPEPPEVLTKRSLLSIVNKIFDPMGFLSPAMVYPKLMLQEAWAKKLDWDEELPEPIKGRFWEWTKELKCLEFVNIPRKMMGENPSHKDNSLQYHAFCDASQKAYSAAVFLRAEQEGGDVSVQLLQAKARVAPLKRPSIPRLELLGCVILARLAKTVREALKYDIPIYYWCDSTTAIAWIQRNDDWGTFVGNRVREICQSTKADDWRHVPGVQNPADFPSRGGNPRDLLDSNWWEGPTWLKRTPSEWPIGNMDIDENLVIEERKKSIAQVTCSQDVPLVVESTWYSTKFSSFASTVRVMSWILRFVNNVRKSEKRKGELTVDEIDSAEKVIFQIIQKELFPPKQDYIAGIQIQKSELDGLLRVKTKIVNRADSKTFKWPILLPNVHPIVDRMIREEHLKSGHGGIQFIIGKLREKVWIIQTRRAVKRVVQSCVICRRYKAKGPTVPVAPLPENRVKDSKVFEIIGVDLAGPLFLKGNSKSWIVVFTCSVIRAVHLEVVSSLNTDSFLLALSRFISRRGRPSVIYSDNGTNLRGADNSFKNLDWDKIRRETRLLKIQWIFNPPSAPWWGGFWERLIQTIKGLLRRMLGHSKLSYVQLETCLCQVEAVVNGRPLTYVTEDPDDLVPLTPASFLQDVQEIEFPEIEVLDARAFRGKYREFVQLKEELRNRFRSEYLGQLVQRVKSKPVRDFKIGDIVLVADDNLKRLEWPMAKIIELITGKDGNIRVARVRTAGGELLRPIQRLIPLEVPTAPNPLPVTSQVIKHAKSIVEKTERTKKNIHEGDVIVTRVGRQVKKPIRFRFN